MARSLATVVAENPYTDFATWWPMGEHFLAFMAEAICSQWQAAGAQEAQLVAVQREAEQYIELVYQRTARATLAADFLNRQNLASIQSGEFDALSYAFYKSAFDLFAAQRDGGTLDGILADARHSFTQRVGQIFYRQLHDHLALQLPVQLSDATAFEQLTQAIAQVGAFLKQQGYLRDHFAFRFDVAQPYQGKQIVQTEADVVARFQQAAPVYALYEMGYPVILPSAVYLYQTQGEAQHHSSRTIEELFGRIGYIASETPDFDPTGYPSDLVVELWEIRR